MNASWVLAALLLAAPALLAFVVLAVTGALAPGDAAVAAVAVAAAIVLLSSPLYLGLIRLRRAIDLMAENSDARPEVETTSPAIRDLWLAIMRWERASRAKAQAREIEIGTAQLVLHHLPDPLLVLDETRRIVRTNEAADRLLGPNLIERDLAVALRQPALLAAADAVLRREGDRLVEFDLTEPVERHFSARIAPLTPVRADGSAVLILHDVTVLKRSERLRADFAANASHELRTPLASLIGFIETLRGPARDDLAAHDKFLGIMAEQSARMGRLVEDLLSLAKIEMNEHQTPTDRVDLAALLGRVASALDQRAAARSMTIEVAVPSGQPPVLGDSEELTQVFQNLIDNAIKYARAGTAISVEAAPSTKRAASLAVTIRDQGEGIPRDHLARLTERFYRVDTARSRELGGTGLGLAIVKHIVNHHRGLLEIESELGKGSAFTVHLPLAGAGAATASPPETLESRH
ncbi:MAG TPA: ATP-binding protein [Stellaceae bacterium]|jgi:two-component system phosphate regulon sensor histidine kinase PhoR